MSHAECKRAQQQLDDLLDGYLSPVDAAATEAHAAACIACAMYRHANEALRMALREMPTPEMRAGFADAAIAAAVRRAASIPVTRGPGKARRRWLAAWHRPEAWLGATVGAAAAAGLLLMMLSTPQTDVRLDESAPVRITLYEPRDIGLAIDAEHAMPGATLTVLVAGGIDLVGFGERREVQWQTDLDSGTNVLSLPIIAHSLEDGLLTARVQHGDRTKLIEVRVQIDAPKPD